MPDFADTRVSTAGTGMVRGIAQTAVSGNACLVKVGGITVTARAATGLTIAAGNVLLLARLASTYYVINVVPAAPTTTPATPAPADSTPVDTGDTPPAPKPVVRTGTLTCVPTATACYRDGSWRSDGDPTNSFDLYQGRYGGSSYGRNTGVAFYGSKPHTLSGATCTRATVQIKRLSAGDYAARSATLRLVSQTSRPGGAPTLNETTSGPSLTIGATSTFTLPTSWGQALIDGTRGGIGISVSSDDPYIHLAGRGSWSAAFTVTISWRRSS
ncbi:hypothetical protein EDD90_7401 [Streptomyces sp. Ag109_O5-1]|uniref:hypothetical protein n=1 Tax=Streptomyces sp. Ag109_O5-1 TaxID=1938851 RepID=UPI000F50F758|nr:hypothetical protein [Streptomyces sp. Ag109_O5-1]RPE44171.1 hypothetical protein EDD90_7401 [Streptomyces sp. Ag109_O5-1]